MADDIVDIEFAGPGPFAIPLLERFESSDIPGHLDFAVLRFRFEDGAPVRVPISSQALSGLLGALQAWKMLRDQKQANDQTKH